MNLDDATLKLEKASEILETAFHVYEDAQKDFFREAAGLSKQERHRLFTTAIERGEALSRKKRK